MPVDDAPCKRCGQSFPYSDDPNSCCSKCADLVAEKAGGPGYTAIDVQPQCMGCGVYYPALKGHCGRCMGRMGPFEDNGPDPALIVKRADEHAATASKYRLNQSSGLAKAHKLKAKENVLKQQRKAETITIETQLFMFAAGATTAKKIQIPAFLEKVFATDNADAALNVILQNASAKYLASPMPKPHILPSFARTDIQFSVMQGGTKAHSFDELKSAMVSDMFERLKQSGHLTEKDVKNKTIVLRIDIWAGTSDTDDEDNFEPRASARKKPVSSRTSVPSLRVTAAKRKIVLSSGMAAAGPPAKRYQSAFKAPQLRSEFSSATALTFDSYQFMQTFCTVNGEGGITLIEKSESETILVAKGWQKFARSGEPIEAGVSTQGYLSHGYSKFAFRGVLGSVHLAIFQARPLGIYSSTESENTTDLTNELKVLSIAQYFLDTFKKRAVSYGYMSLPGLEFNANGAFMGKLTKNIDPPPADGEFDNRSLIYNTFLATPLLPFGKPGYVEDKWSGTNQTGDNQTSIGRVLAAFAHHSVVDSNKTCLLVDLQGLVSPAGAITLIDPQAHTTWPGGVGHFDRGSAGIEQFLKEHKCNIICKSIGLSAPSGKKGLHCDCTYYLY